MHTRHNLDAYDAGTKWTSITHYVDIDTGENVNRQSYKTEYKKIKTTKYAYRNKQKTKGTVEYTILCRRNSVQGKLF